MHTAHKQRQREGPETVTENRRESVSYADTGLLHSQCLNHLERLSYTKMMLWDPLSPHCCLLGGRLLSSNSLYSGQVGQQFRQQLC